MFGLFLALTAAQVAPETPAKIGFLTAGELDRRCESTSATDSSYCFAYIAAVHDSVRSYELWLNIQEFCEPPGTAQAELRATFVDYMRSHPGDGAGQAASVVVVALKRRFPCAPRPVLPSQP